MLLQKLRNRLSSDGICYGYCVCASFGRYLHKFCRRTVVHYTERLIELLVYVGCETAAWQAFGSICASLLHIQKYAKVCSSLGEVADTIIINRSCAKRFSWSRDLKKEDQLIFMSYLTN
jgi:hypothetical protein